MTEHESRNNGAKTGRTDQGQFAAGNSGRPKGARHKVTRAVEALLEGDAVALTRKAVEMALDGDTVALRLCLEHQVPARKDSPVSFEAPKIESAADASAALAAIVNAVATGDLTPSEAASLSGLIESFRRTLETEDLERRVTALEEGR